VAKNVRFTPHSEESFLIGRRARRDSAITYEFPAPRTVCQKTDEFPVPVTPSLIGRFSPIAENS
jgi:hypothetical protein